VLPAGDRLRTGCVTKAIGLPELFVLTVSVAAALVTDPFRFVIVTVYAPALRPRRSRPAGSGSSPQGWASVEIPLVIWSWVPEASTRHGRWRPGWPTWTRGHPMLGAAVLLTVTGPSSA